MHHSDWVNSEYCHKELLIFLHSCGVSHELPRCFNSCNWFQARTMRRSHSMIPSQRRTHYSSKWCVQPWWSVTGYPNTTRSWSCGGNDAAKEPIHHRMIHEDSDVEFRSACLGHPLDVGVAPRTHQNGWMMTKAQWSISMGFVNHLYNG